MTFTHSKATITHTNNSHLILYQRVMLSKLAMAYKISITVFTEDMLASGK